MKAIVLYLFILAARLPLFAHSHPAGSDDSLQMRPGKMPVREEPQWKRKGSVSGRHTTGVGDWIHLNINAGAALYQNYVVVPIRSPHTTDKWSGESYTLNSKSVGGQLSPCIGIDAVLGKPDKVAKHLLGVSYFRADTYYNYSSFSGSPPWPKGTVTGSFEDKSIHGTYDFINLVSGIDFKIGERMNMSLASSINFIAGSSFITSGKTIVTTVTDTSSNNNPQYVNKDEITTYNNTRTNERKTDALFSFQMKLFYEFPVKKTVLNIYVLGSVSIYYRLPYAAFGVSWYPFKKLRSQDL